MESRKTLLRFLLILTLSLAFTEALASKSGEKPSAYEMLERFSFPKGILPEGVQGYSLKEDGSFEVLLSGDCEFKVEGGYLLKYKKKITGKVKSGSLKGLNGVSVKILMVWFGINEVVRIDSNLYFYVGPLSASFPLNNFEECPQCRCGFDCGNVGLVADS